MRTQHIFQEDQLFGLFLLDFLQVIAEARFRGAPVRDGVAVGFVVALNFVSYQSFSIEGLPFRSSASGVGFAEPRVEDEFGRAARIANALRLVERHVVGHAVFGLAGGEALEERRAAIFQAVEDGAVEFRRIGDRDLRDERRSVAGEERLGHGLSSRRSFPAWRSPNTFMSFPPSMGVESEFCPPVLE